MFRWGCSLGSDAAESGKSASVMCAPGAPWDPSAARLVRAAFLTLLGRCWASPVLPVADGSEAAVGHTAGSSAQLEATVRPVMVVAIVPFVIVNL